MLLARARSRRAVTAETSPDRDCSSSTYADEVGYLPLASEAAAALFQVVKSAAVLTTNLGIVCWGQIFDDPTVAVAMLDRLLHRSVVFNIDGESYRMRAHRTRAENFRKAVSRRPNT